MNNKNNYEIEVEGPVISLAIYNWELKNDLENVEERDRIDQTREVGPLRQADDAILLDNSHMSIAEQKEWLTEKFQAAING